MNKMLSENYEKNPAFDFNQNCWKIEGSELDKFCMLYENAHSRLNKSKSKKIYEALDEVFQSLNVQTYDQNEIDFLKELKFEITKFLKDEFKFRRIIKPNMKPTKKAELVELKNLNRFYGEISEETLHKIQESIIPEIAKFRKNAKNGLLKRSDLSSNSGTIVDEVNSLVEREFQERGIFRIVSDYVGIKYQTVGVSIELSAEGSTWWRNNQTFGKAPRTMYAHLDESIFAPKAIIYLSDVGLSNGPTCGYPGVYEKFQNNPLQDIIGRVISNVGNVPNSNLFNFYNKKYHQSFASENFRKHFMKLPVTLRFNSHLGWDILPGSKLETEIAENEEILLGKAGKFVVFDGSKLLHRGGLIEAGERIVLQVVFSRKASILKRVFLKLRDIYDRVKK
jgi:hypothetical protein